MLPIFRTPKQLGTELRRRRKAKGLTQGELGLKINKRQATVSTLESEGSATLETLFAVISALDLELAVQPRSKGTRAKLEDVF
jgi:HTH-type transcriptional regulator / antitoxin HipB